MFYWCMTFIYGDFDVLYTVDIIRNYYAFQLTSISSSPMESPRQASLGMLRWKRWHSTHSGEDDLHSVSWFKYKFLLETLSSQIHPEIIFYQSSVQPLALSSWDIQSAITVWNHVLVLSESHSQMSGRIGLTSWQPHHPCFRCSAGKSPACVP